ncbi:hypothetical protein SASPL_114932 [Salvia splendens]|uniref:Uncharacterized protein n=1 Tax=Salvia splendens TaxID=180675 RepID=A0A8X9A2J0_SALSN|nr:hypothetical protein SASPL_114932 [Salvia splendens]
MFKKIFLLLMETALIKTSPCGYVRPRIVDILGDLQKIKKHDWCMYLLDNLLRTRELWKNNRSKVFSGPLVFLVYDENELGSAKMSTVVKHPASTEDFVENGDGSEELVYIRGVWGAVKHIGDGFKLQRN